MTQDGEQLDIELLLKEAEGLKLPCFDLVPAGAGDRVLAHWGGRRSDLPEQFPRGVIAYRYQKHFLSVEQQLFDRLGLQGRGPLVLSMFTTVEGDEQLNHVNVSTGNLSEVSFTGSVPLAAKPQTSLPPLEAVLLYGGPMIEEWLMTRKLKRSDYWGIESPIRNAYLEKFTHQHPLYTEHPPYARVGGWHIAWPDDDFYIPREMRLMVWTFHGAEPWYEVFLSPQGNYVIKSRIT